MKLKRLSAYLIDILLIYFIANTIFMVVFKDEYSRFAKSSEEYIATIQKVAEKTKDTKSIETIAEETKELNYNYLKLGTTSTILTLSIQIIYFVFAQYFNNGQTLGKKILKIRIKQIGEERLNAGLFVLRESLLFVLPIKIIDLVCLLTTKMNTYLTINALTSNIETLVTLAIIGFMLFRNDGRGLHEIISRTEVVPVKKEKE